MGRNQNLPEGEGPIFLGMQYHLPYLIGIVVIGIAMIFLLWGRERTLRGWHHGKGLVPPVSYTHLTLPTIDSV